MDLTTAPRAELIRIIYELQYKVETLEAQLAEMRSRLDQQGPKPGLKMAPVSFKQKYEKRLEEMRITV